METVANRNETMSLPLSGLPPTDIYLPLGFLHRTLRIPPIQPPGHHRMKVSRPAKLDPRDSSNSLSPETAMFRSHPRFLWVLYSVMR